MRKVAITFVMGALVLGALGCHADPNDAAGQAGELSDPVRREHAIGNIQRLYSEALSANESDRESAAVKAVTDATIEKLNQAYLDHPEDTQNGKYMLDVMYEMRDPRALPALTQATKWRSEVTEEHAIRAAQAFKVLAVPEENKGDVITALSEALERVTGARSVDNRMRIEFIRALGNMEDPRATPILTRVATTQTEEQNFIINRLAAQQLGRTGDPAAVPAMIKCLFLFAPNSPAMRMNDVAAEALVRIGRPAYDPLLKVLAGEDEEAKGIVNLYIEAVRARDERAAAQMSAEQIMGAEATFALGALGFREALGPIMAETQSEDTNRRINSVIALVRLNLEEGERGRVRDVLKSVYGDAPLAAKPQLLAAMRHLYDAELLPFFLEQAADKQLHPAVRIEAVVAHALLANNAESAQLRNLIRREDASADGGERENFEKNVPALDAATSCDEDVACWIGKLGDSDALVVRKASYMLGRFGRANGDAIAALVQRLGHTDIAVRLAVLTAIDRIAVSGSAEGVAKIDELQEAEEGRKIWSDFSREALPIQARLRNRAAN